MSGIGGIMDIENYCVDVDRLNKMRLALSLRGRRRSTAFLSGSVGMFFNSSSPYAFTDTEDRQPNICERRGHSYALCIDSDELDSSSVLEKYLVHGVDFLGALDLPFALSLYDGERNMLLLARDKKGRKPLFYRFDGNNILFSSEVKGITGAHGGYVHVDRDRLSSHLTSPMGIYGASDIYTDIRQVLPGECILFTRMGMSRFFYRDIRERTAFKGKNSLKSITVIKPYPIFDSQLLWDTLSEALIAFDYPQFDSYMPSLCLSLSEAQKKGKNILLFEDCTRRKNISYAFEREDRLGNLYGVRATGVLSKEQWEDPYLASVKNELCGRLSTLGNSHRALLQGILGVSRFDSLCRKLERTAQKNEEAEESIRILGMLLQTVDWASANRLLIKDEGRAVCYDYF